MSELLIKRLKNHEDCDDSDCCGWDTFYCCPLMRDNFAEAGGGGLFYIDAHGRVATGLLIDPAQDGGLVRAVACPFCGASVRVVEEIPEKEHADADA